VVRLADVIGEHPLFLDVTRLNPIHPVATRDGERAVLECIYEASRSRGLRFVPVMWVGESTDDHRRLVEDASFKTDTESRCDIGCGSTCSTRRGLEDYVAAELTSLGRDPKDADLIVDLEYIDPTTSWTRTALLRR